MAALFRNVATWCQGLAEGWHFDLYTVLILGAWIDNRDGKIYAYEADEASIIVLTAMVLAISAILMGHKARHWSTLLVLSGRYFYKVGR